MPAPDTTKDATPTQEAVRDPFRFLAARGWRPEPTADGTWRHDESRVLSAALAIQAELAAPPERAPTGGVHDAPKPA